MNRYWPGLGPPHAAIYIKPVKADERHTSGSPTGHVTMADMATSAGLPLEAASIITAPYKTPHRIRGASDIYRIDGRGLPAYAHAIRHLLLLFYWQSLASLDASRRRSTGTPATTRPASIESIIVDVAVASAPRRGEHDDDFPCRRKAKTRCAERYCFDISRFRVLRLCPLSSQPPGTCWRWCPDYYFLRQMSL